MNTMEDNKDVKVLKNELWTRQVIIEAEVVIIRENKVIEDMRTLKRNLLHWISKPLWNKIIFSIIFPSHPSRESSKSLPSQI